eukprot:SAG31_NODE_42892_length_269_cov_1.164706_1_plen_43_part_01
MVGRNLRVPWRPLSSYISASPAARCCNTKANLYLDDDTAIWST